jgi:hypothetical protein
MAKSTLKKAFLYLELLMTIALLGIFLTLFFSWYKGYVFSVKNLKQYYQDRNQLVNLAEKGEGATVLVTKNIYLKTVSVNNLSLQYLDTQSIN